MIQPNKMIYQPPKYHSNSFTHFLQLHSSINHNHHNNNVNNSFSNSNRTHEDLNQDEHAKLEILDTASNASNTSLEVVNDSIGKSFTIAAILGLKKNSVNHLRQACELEDVNGALNDYNSEFPSLINLTAHTKLFQKFDNDNRHNYMQQQQSSEHPQMPIEQCMYDNSTTSNSSYSEHLHKHNINPEFNSNYNRNAVEDSPMNPQANPALRNHIHPHANSSLLNKAFNRDRSRMDPYNASKGKSSLSLKNKRVRTIFTPEQLERLEAEFERQQYMVGPERLYLAHTLQLTEAQVKVWFQNRRIKWRKHHLEITQQHLAIARQRQIPVPMPSTSRNMTTSEESVQSDGQIVSDGED